MGGEGCNLRNLGVMIELALKDDSFGAIQGLRVDEAIERSHPPAQLPLGLDPFKAIASYHAWPFL